MVLGENREIRFTTAALKRPHGVVKKSIYDLVND